MCTSLYIYKTFKNCLNITTQVRNNTCFTTKVSYNIFIIMLLYWVPKYTKAGTSSVLKKDKKQQTYKEKRPSNLNQLHFFQLFLH